jgi:hypothetical protein
MQTVICLDCDNEVGNAIPETCRLCGAPGPWGVVRHRPGLLSRLLSRFHR